MALVLLRCQLGVAASWFGGREQEGLVPGRGGVVVWSWRLGVVLWSCRLVVVSLVSWRLGVVVVAVGGREQVGLASGAVV